jgi:sugar phosphate isomerase/epimerase
MRIFAFADEADKLVDGQIAAMKRNGLQGLEVRGVDGVNVSKITLDKARELRKKMDDNDLVTWSIGSPIGKIKLEDDFNAHLDTLRHCLEVADILGAKNLRLFSFYMPKDEDPTPYKNEVIDRMGAFLDVARGSGVLLCHENEKGIYGDIASRCLELHQALPELGGIFDPANYVQCGQDTLEAWDMLHTYIDYMHIKDAKLDGTVVLPGTGDGHVPEIIAKYVAQGGKLFTLEPHLSEFVGLSELEQANNKSLVGHMTFPTPEAAFDAAAQNLVKILGAL